MVASVDDVDADTGNVTMTVGGQPIELTPPEIADALADDNRAVRIEGASNGLGTGETIALATAAALIVPAGLAKLIARKRAAVVLATPLPAGSPLPPPVVS